MFIFTQAWTLFEKILEYQQILQKKIPNKSKDIGIN